MSRARSILDGLYDRNLSGLSRAMDLTWRRNQALASNVANAETPQYRAADVSFGGELERAFGHNPTQELKMTSNKHLALLEDSGSRLVADYSGETRADGNNVDIDLQMGKLTHNSGQYSVAAQMVRRKMQLLREAIRGGQ